MTETEGDEDAVVDEGEEEGEGEAAVREIQLQSQHLVQVSDLGFGDLHQGEQPPRQRPLQLHPQAPELELRAVYPPLAVLPLKACKFSTKHTIPAQYRTILSIICNTRVFRLMARLFWTLRPPKA